MELVEVLLELKVEVLFTELHMLSPSNQEKSRESRTHKRGFFGRILGDTSQTTGVSQEGLIRFRFWCAEHVYAHVMTTTLTRMRYLKSERLEFKKFEICSVEESLKCFYIRLREKMSQRVSILLHKMLKLVTDINKTQILSFFHYFVTPGQLGNRREFQIIRRDDASVVYIFTYYLPRVESDNG